MPTTKQFRVERCSLIDARCQSFFKALQPAAIQGRRHDFVEISISISLVMKDPDLTLQGQSFAHFPLGRTKEAMNVSFKHSLDALPLAYPGAS